MVLSKSVLGILAAAALAPGCVTAGKYYALEDELARTREDLAYAQSNLAKAEDVLTEVNATGAEVSELQGQLAEAQARNQALQSRLQEMESAAAVLQDVDGMTTVINREEGMIGYSGKGDVFFPSGSDALTKEGKEALKLVVGELRKQEYPIRIDGHTDTDPIVRTKDRWTKGNIQLGAARAISVREFLIEQGIDAGRIAIASFGEFKPVSDGADDAAKARNRRVEVMMKVSDGASSH